MSVACYPETAPKVRRCPWNPNAGRIVNLVDVNGNPTGTVGVEGDYFAPNSIDAYWWPPAARALAADEVQAAAMTHNVPQPLSQIRDGLSSTLLVSELAGRPDYWIMGIYSFHTAGANALFVDGSVHFLREGLNRDIFAGLVTRAGKEVIANETF